MTELELKSRGKCYLLRELPIDTKFFIPGKSYPYWKESYVNQSSLRCTCCTLAKRMCHGKVIIRRIRIQLSMSKEVYVIRVQ